MKLRVSTYALAVTDGKVLLTQLAAKCYNAGKWTLPGGGMDHGEQPLESMHREVYEETALRASDVELAHAVSYSEDGPRGPFMAVQIIYKATIVGEPRVLEEGGTTADVRWIPLDEIEALPTVSLVDHAMSLLAR